MDVEVAVKLAVESVIEQASAAEEKRLSSLKIEEKDESANERTEDVAGPPEPTPESAGSESPETNQETNETESATEQTLPTVAKPLPLYTYTRDFLMSRKGLPNCRIMPPDLDREIQQAATFFDQGGQGRIRPRGGPGGPGRWGPPGRGLPGEWGSLGNRPPPPGMGRGESHWQRRQESGNKEENFYNEWEKSFESFDQMGLHENLLRGIHAYGFENPSAIQKKGIVPFIEGLDVIQQAESGTGKTAVFCAGILQKLDQDVQNCQALVLAPTREIAQQNAEVMRALGEFLSVKCHAIVGGTSIRDDTRLLQQGGVRVIVGTPGRIYDMIRRRALATESIKMFVLDEADSLLSDSFKDQINDIFKLLPPKLQVGVFSATNLRTDAMESTRKLMTKPVRILVKHDEPSIKQYYVKVEREEGKLDILRGLYKTWDINRSVIFANTKQKVEWIAKEMRMHGHTFCMVHGDIDQNTRDAAMRDFRSQSGSTPNLIAHDIFTHGIDLQALLVINYDLPILTENYVRRIGRCGRFELKGVAISFVT